MTEDGYGFHKYAYVQSLKEAFCKNIEEAPTITRQLVKY